MKIVLKPLAKSVLLSASAADTALQKKTCGSDLAQRATTLITSNEEMEDIMKTVKSREESGLLIKSTSETIGNEAKEQEVGVPRMLLGKLDASLLGNPLASKGVYASDGVIRADEGATATNGGRNYQNELRFDGVYSRNKWSTATVPARATPRHAAPIKDGAYVINLDGYKSIGSDWIV